ncbi:hypothetical protein BRC86_02950 [Halobacteriales archaeon QS_3_64_16]|nr:MAG: hypothetical protein BRC86_02950 [Halobacteriales archaeon QS_3_64_16]
MAYACPVCATPQADGRHLANHLAFTAMIHGEDHEAWLDEHAPDWQEAGEDALANRVIGQAPETELSAAIEDPIKNSEQTHNGEETGESESHSHHQHDHSEHEHAHGAGPRADLPPTSEANPSRDEERTAVGFGTDPGETDTEDKRDLKAVLAEARELTERMRDESDTASTDGESETSKRNPSGAESREDNGDSDESEGER